MADMTLSEVTQRLLLEAVWELDKLGRVLPNLVPLDDDQNHYAVKGVAGRMVRLTSALMDGLQGTSDDGALARIVNFDEEAGQG